MSIEQLNIFDQAPEPAQKRRKLEVGELVKVKFYDDEMEYVQQRCPELLKVGTIVEKQLDFCRVEFGQEIVHVIDIRKLKIV